MPLATDFSNGQKRGWVLVQGLGSDPQNYQTWLGWPDLGSINATKEETEGS